MDLGDRDALIASYRQSLGPPPGAQARVLDAVEPALSVDDVAAVDARPVRFGPWIAVSAVAAVAAATILLWPSRGESPIQSESDPPNTAVYDHDRAATDQKTTSRGRKRDSVPAAERTPEQPLEPTPLVNTEDGGSEHKEVAEPMPRVSRRRREPQPPSADEASDEPTKDRPPAPTVTARAPEIAALVATLGRVDQKLAAGRAEEALALLRGRRRAFSAAGLSVEYDGYHVLALCSAGRWQAAKPLQVRFAERYPRSLYATRIAGACKSRARDSETSEPPR